MKYLQIQRTYTTEHNILVPDNFTDQEIIEWVKDVQDLEYDFSGQDITDAKTNRLIDSFTE